MLHADTVNKKMLLQRIPCGTGEGMDGRRHIGEEGKRSILFEEEEKKKKKKKIDVLFVSSL